MKETEVLQSNDLTDAQLLGEIERMQTGLKPVPIADLIRNSGAALAEEVLTIDVFFKAFEIHPATYALTRVDGQPESLLVQSLILAYLTTADGTPYSQNLISFRELPDGHNYCHAFQGYAPDRLARHFNQDMEGFCGACRRLGGVPVGMGDAGFAFDVFPMIRITVVYYLGDELFSASASLLFDSNVSHYMVTAGLASIGAALVDMIIKNRSPRT